MASLRNLEDVDLKLCYINFRTTYMPKWPQRHVPTLKPSLKVVLTPAIEKKGVLILSVRYETSADNKLVRIRINGEFDAHIYSDFRRAFSYEPEAVNYEVDLSGVSNMDSSGLGLLIQLKEHAAASGCSVVLLNPSEIAKRNLEMAFFHEIFEIVS